MNAISSGEAPLAGAPPSRKMLSDHLQLRRQCFGRSRKCIVVSTSRYQAPALFGHPLESMLTGILIRGAATNVLRYRARRRS